MKTRLRSMVVGVAALVIAAGLAVTAGGVANAAVTPAFEPDPLALGTLTLYDASGAVITGGNVNDSPFVAYAAASGPGREGDSRAFVRVATPKANTPTDQFLSSLLSSSSAYPNPNAPAPINGFTNPVVSLPSGAPSLASAIANNPNTETSADLANIYEIRLITTAPGQPASIEYYRVDILVDPAAGTWSVVYQAPTATTTAISADPASPAAHGSTVNLTANVGPAGAAGSVHFFDGATDLGPGSYDPATGAATLAVQPSDGDHTFRAEFTPANSSEFAGSRSADLPYTVTPAPPATPTATTLAVVPNGTLPHGVPVLFVAQVAPAGAPGSVHIFDGSTDLGPSIYLAPIGIALFVAIPSDGDHSYTAHFVPANPAQFTDSTSAAVTVTIQPCNACSHAV